MPASSNDIGDRHNIIVIGASAGGVEALKRLVAGLPRDLPAALFVVMHIPPNIRSILPAILSYSGPLPAEHAIDGERIQPGRIYVAPPDRHLLVERDAAGQGIVRLSAGPRENQTRPAVDPLFRSAAQAFGPRVIGVVLTGSLSDGTAGLWEIKERGGLAVVQDPGEALYSSMPHSAIDQVPVDYILPVNEIPVLLGRLVRERGIKESENAALLAAQERQAAMAGEDLSRQLAFARDIPATAEVNRDMTAQVDGERDRNVTVYVCPECGGTLWQVNAGPFLRFRCHVGHIYGSEELLEGYTEDVERSMWSVVRALRDKANLARQLSNDARARGDAERADRYAARAQLDEKHSTLIEGLIGETASANREITQ